MNSIDIFYHYDFSKKENVDFFNKTLNEESKRYYEYINGRFNPTSFCDILYYGYHSCSKQQILVLKNFLKDKLFYNKKNETTNVARFFLSLLKTKDLAYSKTVFMFLNKHGFSALANKMYHLLFTELKWKVFSGYPIELKLLCAILETKKNPRKLIMDIATGNNKFLKLKIIQYMKKTMPQYMWIFILQ